MTSNSTGTVWTPVVKSNPPFSLQNKNQLTRNQYSLVLMLSPPFNIYLHSTIDGYNSIEQVWDSTPHHIRLVKP